LSENLVVPGIDPGPLDLWPGTLTTTPQIQPVSRILIVIVHAANLRSEQFKLIMASKPLERKYRNNATNVVSSISIRQALNQPQ
jgi:hypothetical protein